MLQGGLGNQLFQLLAAELHALNTKKAIEIHTCFLRSYRSKTEYELPLAFGDKFLRDVSTTSPPSFFGRIRAVKAIGRLARKDISIGMPNGDLYLDGYYQTYSYYKRFADSDIAQMILRFSNAARTFDGTFDRGKSLLHLRLGDFFESEDYKIKYIEDRILSFAGFGKQLDIVTNEEGTVKEILEQKGYATTSLIKTSHLNSGDLMRIMSNYGQIFTNGSSLAMWAALFSGATLWTSNNVHDSFYTEMRRLRKNR